MATMKSTREAADAALAKGIATREALYAALPVLIDLQDAIKSAGRTVKECGDVARRLSEACAKYAREHQSAFDDGIFELRSEILSGDITLNGSTYHFTASPGELRRISGNALGKAFLAGLPEGWTRSRLELNQSGISALGVGATDLEAYDLYRPDKHVWSLKL